MSDFPGGSVVENLPANAGDAGSIFGSGRSPGEGNGNPLQESCLGSPMDRGAWRARVHGVTKSQTSLCDQTTAKLHFAHGFDWPKISHIHWLLPSLFGADSSGLLSSCLQAIVLSKGSRIKLKLITHKLHIFP